MQSGPTMKSIAREAADKKQSGTR